jgi:hypothetical protein
LWSPARGLARAVLGGDAAVTRQALERITSWLR